MVDDVLRALEFCVGSRLDRVEAAAHTHPARPTATIAQIRFDLGDTSISLGTAGPGGLQLTPLTPTADLGEFGRIERQTFSFVVVGDELRSVRRLLASEPELDTAVGVALGFETGQIWIWNSADDLEVAEVAPGLQQIHSVRTE